MVGAGAAEKVRVVVGDDHPLFRDGVVRALTSSGAVEVVAEAADGTEALAMIKEHAPDVALLDYRMPGMDGAQIAAAVRRDELATRVLLVSAYDESAIVYHALAAGSGRVSGQGIHPIRDRERRARLRAGPRRAVAGSRRGPGRPRFAAGRSRRRRC